MKGQGKSSEVDGTSFMKVLKQGTAKRVQGLKGIIASGVK